MRAMRLKIFLLGLLAIAFIGITQPKTAVKQIFKCLPSDYQCYESYYSNLVKNQGVKEAFQDLKSRYNKDNLVKADCHPLTHAIGRAASFLYKTPGEAFDHGDNFCSSGYYHGVLEGIAAQMGRDKLLANLNSVCSNIKGKNVYSLDYYNCVHGLGHGLMAITDDELFKSLNGCDKLTGNWEKISCASGVYMENIVADGVNHKTKYLKSEDLLYPCDASPDKYKATCYLMQSSYVLREESFNFDKTFSICQEAGKYSEQCYQSMGRDVSGYSVSNINLTKSICLLGKDFNQKSNCLIGAARDFKYYYQSVAKARDLCNSLDDNSLKNTCLNGIY